MSFDRDDGGRALVIAHTWDGEAIALEDRVSVQIEGARDGAEVRIASPYYADPPPAGEPGRHTDALWTCEVVEVFLGGEGYLELELGPHGHYWLGAFSAPRRAERIGMPIEVAARITGARWSARAFLPRELLPEAVSLGRGARWNAYAIHRAPRSSASGAVNGTVGGRRYLAACPVPGKEPDFHRPECFTPLAPLLGLS